MTWSQKAVFKTKNKKENSSARDSARQSELFNVYVRAHLKARTPIFYSLWCTN